MGAPTPVRSRRRRARTLGFGTLGAAAAAVLIAGLAPSAAATPAPPPGPRTLAATTSGPASTVRGPSTGVALDAATGTVFQVDPRGNRLLTFAPKPGGGYVATGSVPTGAGPVSVVVDPHSGAVYTANQTGRSVTTIEKRGTTYSATHTTPLMIAPSTVAVDDQGTVHALSAPTQGPVAPTAAAAPAAKAAAKAPKERQANARQTQQVLDMFTTEAQANGWAASFSPDDYVVSYGSGYTIARNSATNTVFCQGTCTNVAVGAAGVNGADGQDGGTGYCIGQCTNVASGGRGGDGVASRDYPTYLSSTGGRGGAGGTGYCQGVCTNVANGGAGGNATVVGLSGQDQYGTGDSVYATAGQGGAGGTGTCTGTCTAVGDGGAGGRARATAGDGLDGAFTYFDPSYRFAGQGGSA